MSLDTIQNLFEIKPPSPTRLLDSLEDFQKELKIYSPTLEGELSTIPKKILIRSLNTMVGIEIETEGVRDNEFPFPSFHFLSVADGSLRNNGVEYISKMGNRAHNLSKGLVDLFKWLKGGNAVTSDRTSIHVHVNVLNMSLEELNSFIILYTVVEDSLFGYAGKFRENNIFCTPLSYSIKNSDNTLENFLRRSSKYAAFNTKAVEEKGTVEFRHMHTSYDFEYVYRWVIMLCLLRYYSRYHSLEEIKQTIINIRNRSEYGIFYRNIFFGLADHLVIDPMKVDSLASDAKLFFFGDN